MSKLKLLLLGIVLLFFSVSGSALSLDQAIHPALAPTPTADPNFLILHQFAGQANNGRIPYGLLVLYNGAFYGTTT